MEGGEEERDRNTDVREKHRLFASRMWPDRDPNSELPVCRTTTSQPTDRATPAEAETFLTDTFPHFPILCFAASNFILTYYKSIIIIYQKFE